VELIVQPGANDGVGEMGVRGDLPPGYTDSTKPPNETRSDACGVERAKVHVKFFRPTHRCRFRLENLVARAETIKAKWYAAHEAASGGGEAS
jgi:hypothetical protein